MKLKIVMQIKTVYINPDSLLQSCELITITFLSENLIIGFTKVRFTSADKLTDMGITLILSLITLILTVQKYA